MAYIVYIKKLKSPLKKSQLCARIKSRFLPGSLVKAKD